MHKCDLKTSGRSGAGDTGAAEVTVGDMGYSEDAGVVWLDEAHLARYTLGMREIEDEILALFVGEAERLIANVASAGNVADAAAWHAACHGLKGSARGVGAFILGDAAEAAERAACPADPLVRERYLGALRETLRATATAIANRPQPADA